MYSLFAFWNHQVRIQSGRIKWYQRIPFHTLCEGTANDLELTLSAIEDKFGNYLGDMDWVNLGGGHLITKPGYDITKLCGLIGQFRKKYNLGIYLEPGEAIVLDAGVLVANVLDIVHNEIDIAILDTSATAHMPDVLEMPYQPDILGAAKTPIFPCKYQLAGLTCVAGDIIGDYYFPEPLECGSQLIFRDMLQYTMVRNTTFNGINLPGMATWSANDGLKILREFDHHSYKSRL